METVLDFTLENIFFISTFLRDASDEYETSSLANLLPHSSKGTRQVVQLFFVIDQLLVRIPRLAR